MVQTKHMNESFFAQLLKDFNVVGELIRARQEEKQALLDQFDTEGKRFFFGKISRRALEGSVKKTNSELQRLDKEIRNNITRGRSISERAQKLVSAQSPIYYKTTLSGISGGKKKVIKKKKVVRKKVIKKKTTAKKKTTKKKR